MKKFFLKNTIVWGELYLVYTQIYILRIYILVSLAILDKMRRFPKNAGKEEIKFML